MKVTAGLAIILGLAAIEASAEDRPAAKNVILMIGDGMGYNHVEAADLYMGRKAAYEAFPFRFAVSTYPGSASDAPGGSPDGSYDPALAWKSFDYVLRNPTDSAAAATAMATGVKTYNGALGVDRLGKPLKNIIEHAEALGKATGVVTTVQLSHATPAGFVAHNPKRSRYEDIAREMILRSAVDVIVGAGHPWYDDDGNRKASPGSFEFVGGRATWEALDAGTAGADADGDRKADPWKLVQDRAGFRALASGSTPKRLLGVVPVSRTLQQARSGDRSAAPGVVPRNPSVPTLAELTRAALNVLDEDPDGFFLMVEGGAVDWASHGNEAGRMIEEELDFDAAVDAVIEWVEGKGGWNRTVVIVTGDHETGYLTGPGSGTTSHPMWKPLKDNGKGVPPELEWHTTHHTNSLIPLYARGEAARLLVRLADRVDPVRGRYLDNAELGAFLIQILR